MSKYTTQLRFICEQAIGLEESGGFENIENTITEAAPLIFNFPYPIFDEEYRRPLEKKILRHYFLREIGQETVGEFKYRLSVKMNEIMPLMNQYYQSALLQFNPLHDVDVWTDHKKDFGEQSTENNDRVANETSQRNLNRETDDVYSGEKITDNNTNETENIAIDGTNHNTEDSEHNRTENANGTRATNGSRNKTETENYGKNSETNTNENRTLEREEQESETRNRTEDKQTNGTINKETSTHSKEVKHEDNKDFNWNLYSDTPQGSVKIFGSDVVTGRYDADPEQGQIYNEMNDGIIDTVAGESYLTDARRTISHGVLDGTVTADGTINENTVSQESVFVKDNATITKTRSTGEDENTTTTTIGTESGNKTTESVEEYSENENTTNALTGNTTGNIVNDGEHSENTDRTNNIEFDGKINDNSRRDTDTIEEENRNQDITENISRIGTINNTESYIEHIAGKRGGQSYSHLLMEFRESFINTDKLIIDELNCLFFGLW